MRAKTLFLLVCMALPCFNPAMADTSKFEDYNRQFWSGHNVVSVANEKGLDAQTLANRNFVLSDSPVQTVGSNYVIITDLDDPTCLKSLEALKEHYHASTIKLSNFGELANSPKAAADLIAKLKAAQPRYVAIAPRAENFRENVLLSLWSVFSKLTVNGQVTVFPGWLVAPDAASFKRLIDHSLQSVTVHGAQLHPMVFAQVPGPRAGGTRAVAKAAFLQTYFAGLNLPTDAFVVKTNAAVRAGIQTPMFDAQKAVVTVDHVNLSALPDTQSKQLAKANLLLLFGHGIPGMTCSINVDAFENTSFANKIVLCGSCFSAAPAHSDFANQPEKVDDAPDANELQRSKDTFASRAIANGASIFYGQMDTNGGFPELSIVLTNLLNGRSAGEAYQRLLNNRISVSGLKPDQFVLRDLSDASAKQARNELLYVMIGDPAAKPIDLSI